MSESRRALILHLAGGGEPLRIAVPSEDVDRLIHDLPKMLISDTPQPITAVDGTTVVVNFTHVAAALVTPMPAMSTVYGNAR
jgi:hypothetical protein